MDCIFGFMNYSFQVAEQNIYIIVFISKAGIVNAHRECSETDHTKYI